MQSHASFEQGGRETFDGNSRGAESITARVEIVMMQPQVKEYQQPPEKDHDGLSLDFWSRPGGSIDTLILAK